MNYGKTYNGKVLKMIGGKYEITKQELRRVSENEMVTQGGHLQRAKKKENPEKTWNGGTDSPLEIVGEKERVWVTQEAKKTLMGKSIWG